MAVAIATSPVLEIGSPREVLTLPPGATFADVTPDGQQILLVKRVSEPVPQPAPREFWVIINFAEEIKRKVATGR
jgi:hypothetical protein